jgi:hypothetical protein
MKIGLHCSANFEIFRKNTVLKKQNKNDCKKASQTSGPANNA